MRPVNHLLNRERLKREDIEYYLEYTTKIFEFADIYEWNSVLNFDFTNRKLQSEHCFLWGTVSSHIELQILVPKRSRENHDVTSTQNAHYQPKEDCRRQKDRASFSRNCRYMHLKHLPMKKQTASSMQRANGQEDA